MVKKQNNFIEEHIEKLVLIIVGLACVYPLYRYVLNPSDAIEFNGRNIPLRQLDIQIEQETEKLKSQLDHEPVLKPLYQAQTDTYLKKMNSAVDITNIIWPLPSAIAKNIDKKYKIPDIGIVKDVSVNYIRAAAYLPKGKITEENFNTQETYEPNDLDLVTVQASFDTAVLFDNFRESFAGKQIPEEWRNEKLAKPVFGAVQLERQRLESDGKWSQWQEVPRTRIDRYSTEFKIIEDMNNLSGSNLIVRLLKMAVPQTQANLLQPEPYKIASSEELWFPPSIHKKYITYQREKEAQERRENIAAEQEDRDRSKADRERRTRTTRTATSATPANRTEMEMMQMSGGAGANPANRGTTRSTRTERERRTEEPPAALPGKIGKAIDDSAIYQEMEKISIAKKDISQLRESIIFWAYDDTAMPGNSYRYRIRLGVFNPVAGKGQLRDEDAAYDNKVTLWSNYSDVTETVEIPQRLYFFPVNVQETAMAVDVQVCKYVLGYWYSEQFVVKRGEMIGRIGKVEPNEIEKNSDKNNETGKKATLPEEIDYGTGALMVDMVAKNDWAGDKNLQSRHYYDVLYSYDGTDIKRMAAKIMYWPDDLRTRYSEIKALEKKPREAFRDWGGTSVIGGQRPSLPRGGNSEQQRMMEEGMRMRGAPPPRQ